MAKKIKSPEHRSDKTLSPALQESFGYFLSCNPPKEFSRNLRDMVIELVSYQKGNYPEYLVPLLLSLEMLFEVLDQAEDEQQK